MTRPHPAPWLVADVGATNARFSLAGAEGLQGETLRLRTADHASSEALLAAAQHALGVGAPRLLRGACLAVAGPVREGRGRITNGTLRFDGDALGGRLGCPVQIVNDFQALARALPDLTHLRQIGGGAPAAGVKAVLGPGSGLGMGMLVPWNGGWRVLASEGGHADLAPGSPLESELLSVLQATHGHVSWETVLSGPGLLRLYGAVCAVWGVEPQAVTAEWVSERGVCADEPVCHQTLEIFFGLLGAAAGNLAVTVCAFGGVYLGGGILPALGDFAEQSPLRRRFEERGAMAGLVQDIPLYLIEDELPGLIGALGWLRDGG